jgi:Uma2 family endonuclease
MYDLPSEDPEEPGLPDEFHIYQPDLLRKTFQPSTYPPEQVFVATDLNLYYDVRHPLWHKRPDWFAVVGGEKFYHGEDLRLSYVIWQEQISPFVVIELLSPNTEDEDLGRTKNLPNQPPTKWTVYESILRIPYYIVFSRYTEDWTIFRWVAGQYEKVELEGDSFPLAQLGLKIGLWQGNYQGIEHLWLRWFTLEGELILTPEEQLEISKQELEISKQELEISKKQTLDAQEKAAHLAAKLRELNIDPDAL